MPSRASVNVTASGIGTCASSRALASAIILEQFDRDSPERHALLRKRWQGCPQLRSTARPAKQRSRRAAYQFANACCIDAER